MNIAERPSDITPTTLIVCVNLRLRADQPSCAGRGAVEQADALERGIHERRINVKVERIRCLGHCPVGPVLRLAPAGAFFSRVEPQDIGEVLDRLEKACGILPPADSEPPPAPGS
jgi:(2Fe-2S) ferredoxin